MDVTSLNSLDIWDKKVLIREDLNVPIRDGKVTSDARIRAALPTLQYALDQGARVMVMSHLGRPQEGMDICEQPEFSLAPVAVLLENLLGIPVKLVDDYLEGFDWQDYQLVLFENVRVNKGEKANDPVLAAKLADLCDVFVMDAFGTAHRAQATTEGIIRSAKVACAGPLLMAELDALKQALLNPRRPLVAIVGGSKVSTKLQVLETLSDKVDQLIVGGGIANTFLAAKGFNVGCSLYEPDLVETAAGLLAKITIPMPTDVVVAEELVAEAVARTVSADGLGDADMILDVGPDTAAHLAEIVKRAGTIIWNGPVGVFEHAQFAGGTESLAHAIAESEAFSLAGGGDTLAAIDQFGVSERISYISTGGGAFLEFVEGKALPAVVALSEKKAAEA